MSKTKSSSFPSPPSDWKFLPFRNICLRLIHGGTPSTSIVAYWNGHTPWITGADFENNNINIIRRHITDRAIKETSTNVVPKGKILLVSRTGVGKIAIADFDVAISQDITGIDLDKSEALDKYIYYALQNEIEEIKKYNQGTSINGILREDLLKHHFPIPSLCEQQSIADILTTLDNLIDHTESLIAKYQSIKQGMMHDLFTRGVDANGRLRPPREEAPELYKESALGWIPREWEVTGLYSIRPLDRPCIKTGPFGSSLKDEHWTETGVPVVTIGSLGDRCFINSELLYIDILKAKELHNYTLDDGDIVFSRVADIGRAAVVTEHEIGWIMSSNLIRISLDKTRVIPSYVYNQIVYSHSIKQQIRILANSGGRDIANTDVVNRIVFCWPSYSEQIQICNIAKQLNNMITSQGLIRNNLGCIKSGLMHDLLTGTVRIPPHLATAQEPPHAL